MAEAAQQDRISVQVNGERRAISAGRTIAGMLRELGIDPRKVAVERNLEVVARSSLDEIAVDEGDSFEIVHFVGGG